MIAAWTILLLFTHETLLLTGFIITVLIPNRSSQLSIKYFHISTPIDLITRIGVIIALLLDVHGFLEFSSLL